MAFRTFLVLFLFVADCLSFNEARRVIYDHYDGNNHHLGCFIKTVKQENDHERTRQNAVGIQDKITLGTNKAIASLDPREGNLEDFSDERVKNDSALPLHVTSTARQECLEGYQADENGTCQKVLAPKGEKTFKLRRKRDQQQPKMSYADVLKYGRTPPFKAEILTTTPTTTEVRASTVVTTVKPVPSGAVGVTTPIVPVKKDEPTVKPTVNEMVTTASVTSPNKTGVTTVPPSVKLADIGVTTLAPVDKVGATTIPSSIKPVVTDAATTTSTDKTKVTTVPPKAKPTAVVPAKPSGLVVPTIISKIPTRVRSFLGDVNRAFLSGEKQSIAAQAADPNPAAKTPAATRLRRWIRML